MEDEIQVDAISHGFNHKAVPERIRVKLPARITWEQLAMKGIKDFTEFEQCAAYFDGDITTVAKGKPTWCCSLVFFRVRGSSIAPTVLRDGNGQYSL